MKNSLLRWATVVSALAITGLLVMRAASCTGSVDETHTTAPTTTTAPATTTPPPPTTSAPPPAADAGTPALEANAPAFLGATKAAPPILRETPPRPPTPPQPQQPVQ